MSRSISANVWMPIDRWFDMAGLSAAHQTDRLTPEELDQHLQSRPRRTSAHAAVRRMRKAATR